MTTGFTFTQSDGRTADVDDILVRRAAFSSGTLWTWGYNGNGALGDGTAINKSSPVTTAGSGITWKQVACGYFVAAIKTDGTLWTWGQNFYGSVGDGTTLNRSSPVTTAGGGTSWNQVSVGYYTLAAIKSDGTLWTLGRNVNGQLGDGTTLNRSSPVTTAGGGTSWSQISGGIYATSAIKTDGTLWTWGLNNNSGQLGDGTTINKSSPVTTAGGGTTWKQVASGGNQTAAVKTDGTLWTWGFNGNGQLGDGTTLNRSSPITTVAGGTTWSQMACGYFTVAAIKTNGTLWTWGLNSVGRLGDGTTLDRSSPVTTAGGGTTWWRVAAGFGNSTAIKSDGTLWTWGQNFYGPVGNGTTLDRSSPVTTVAGFTTWKQMACGYGTTIGIVDITT
jgi:alpha-tubulin suppressor-like RCC1 family protein